MVFFELFNGEHIIFDEEGYRKFSNLSPSKQRELGRDSSDVLFYYGDTFSLTDMNRVFSISRKMEFGHYDKRLKKKTKNIVDETL